jgi:hypothetical protein
VFERPAPRPLRIDLPADVLEALRRLALTEERDVRVQAARLIREALAARGALPAAEARDAR